MSWMVWEEQTCDQIDRLYRAIGSRVIKIPKVELIQCWTPVGILLMIHLFFPSDTFENHMDGQDIKTSGFCRKMSHFIIRYVCSCTV